MNVSVPNHVYLNNLVNVLFSPYNTESGTVRPHYKSDGAPAHTKYITDVTDVYDISKGEFPLSTFRKINWKKAIGELLWMYKDETNDISVLEDKYGVKWWRDWDIEDGTIGHRYGYTIHKYNLYRNLIEGLKCDPFGRRHIIDLWQYEDFNETPGLNPCVYKTIWNVRGKFLDVYVNQRSSDYIVSEGFDRIQYTALLLIVARTIGLKPGKFTYHVNNLHIYDRHLSAALDILARIKDGIENKDPFIIDNLEEQPKLILDDNIHNIYECDVDNFKIENYHPNKTNYKFDIAI